MMTEVYLKSFGTTIYPAGFSGPDDQNLVFIAIKPTRMRLMNKKGEEPQNIELE